MLKNVLSEKKKAIVTRWLDLVLEQYPGKTATFLKREKDRFANPLGYTLSSATTGIFDALLDGGGKEALQPHVEALAKLWAVQEFSAGKALSLFFLLKDALREAASESIADAAMLRELAAFEREIDEAALLAFDAYSECRERLCDIRVNEVKRTVRTLMRRAQGSMQEAEDPVPDSDTEP